MNSAKLRTKPNLEYYGKYTGMLSPAAMEILIGHRSTISLIHFLAAWGSMGHVEGENPGV